MDLHSYLPAGYATSYAYGIDSAGYIVGYAYAGAGYHNAVLWTPNVIPAPGALLLGMIGLTCIGWLRRQKKL